MRPFLTKRCVDRTELGSNCESGGTSVYKSSMEFKLVSH